MPANQSKNYSLAAIVLVVACLISGYIVYSRYWKDYNTAKTELAAAEQNKIKLTDTLNSVEAFLDAYDKEQGNVTLVDLALPSKQSDMANFISSIATLAQTSGVAIANFQISESADKPLPIENTIAPQNIDMAVSGTYLAFKDFLLRLEQHLRIVDINHITLGSGGGSGTGANVLVYQIKLKTYYQQ